MRTCVGCRQARPRPELLRLALTDGRRRVTLDVRCRLPGRGAYLCRDTGLLCYDRARRRHGVSRALRVGDDVVEASALAAALARVTQEDPPSPR